MLVRPSQLAYPVSSLRSGTSTMPQLLFSLRDFTNTWVKVFQRMLPWLPRNVNSSRGRTSLIPCTGHRLSCSGIGGHEHRWTKPGNRGTDGSFSNICWGRVARTINPKNEFGCPTTPVASTPIRSGLVGLLTFQTFKRATCKSRCLDPGGLNRDFSTPYESIRMLSKKTVDT